MLAWLGLGCCSAQSKRFALSIEKAPFRCGVELAERGYAGCKFGPKRNGRLNSVGPPFPVCGEFRGWIPSPLSNPPPSGLSQSISSGSGIFIMGGEDEKMCGAPGRADGVDVTLLLRNDRTGVLTTLSSSSIVLCRYRSPMAPPGNCASLRKSLSFVLRPDEKLGGDSSNMVSI